MHAGAKKISVDDGDTGSAMTPHWLTPLPTQLLMALEADAWVGTRSSNWSRLIDELRCVWVAKCRLPFVEAGVNQPEDSWR